MKAQVLWGFALGYGLAWHHLSQRNLQVYSDGSRERTIEYGQYPYQRPAHDGDYSIIYRLQGCYLGKGQCSRTVDKHEDGCWRSDTTFNVPLLKMRLWQLKDFYQAYFMND